MTTVPRQPRTTYRKASMNATSAVVAIPTTIAGKCQTRKAQRVAFPRYGSASKKCERERRITEREHEQQIDERDVHYARQGRDGESAQHQEQIAECEEQSVDGDAQGKTRGPNAIGEQHDALADGEWK